MTTTEPAQPIQEWFLANMPEQTRGYLASYKQQVMFVRDDIIRLLATDVHWSEREGVATVIGTHHPGVTLPVYSLERPGLRLVMRNNFYNWKLSVISNTPIIEDFAGLFHTSPPIDPEYTGDPLSSVYFEGFPDDLVFGYYDAGDKRKWSAEIYSDHALWMTVFLIARCHGYVQPMTWATGR